MTGNMLQDDAPGDTDVTTLAAAIGVRVRYERQARNWTLDQLAQAARVSRRMLINVEQGTVNPSVGTLLKISDALHVALPVLVAPPQSDPVTVTRNGGGATLWSSVDGGRGLLVVGTATPDAVELWDWTLAPGDEHVSEAHARGSRELLHVHDGLVVVRIENRVVHLDTGDAIAFPGDLPHAYINPSDRSARFSLVVFEPAGRATTRSETTHG